MRLAVAVSLLLLTAGPASAQIYAAVLPSSRAVQVGTPATAFATIVNAGGTTATGCRIAPATTIPAAFSYQTTDPATNQLIGTANTPVDIPAGGSQSFVFGVTPTSPINEDLRFNFECANQPPAPAVFGVNTLKLFACTGQTIPGVSDVIAVVATPTKDGTIAAPSNGQLAAFSVAAMNVGANDSDPACGGFHRLGLPLTVSVLVRYEVSAESSAPVSLSICRTNASGICQGPPSSVVHTQFSLPGRSDTFSVFVSANEGIPFDPANTRIHVKIREHQTVTRIGAPGDSGIIGERGSTSVAVRTQP